MPKCKVCKKHISYSKAWCYGNSEHGYSWKNPEKYPKGFFCSEECADRLNPGMPSHQVGFVSGCMCAIIMAPFNLIGWGIKSLFRLGWWCCKFIIRLGWKCITNKWTWTIITCGMSWVLWRILNALYAPKEKECLIATDAAVENDDNDDGDDGDDEEDDEDDEED